MSKNNLHVLFDDDDILLDAIKKIKEKKHHINEVYTPFPVHGLTKLLDLSQQGFLFWLLFMGVLDL